MKLSFLLSSISEFIVKKVHFQDIEIENLAIDYKQCKKNSFFFCILKEEFSELGIIPPIRSYQKAITKGARVILSNFKTDLDIPSNTVWIQVTNEHLAMAHIIEKFFHHPFQNTKIIGITGTNGKTTTNQFIDGIFTHLKQNPVSVGTLGILTKKQNITTNLTTPLAIDLYKNLFPAYKNRIPYLIIEITSHASYFQRTAALGFDIMIFTNLTSDHLDFHHSWENYKKAKLDHFQRLKKQKKKGIALINKDDSYSKDFLEELKETQVEVYTYGIKDQNTDFSAKILELTDTASSFDVLFQGQYLGTVRIPISGLFNVYNSLAAFCSCYLLDFPVKAIMRALKNTPQIAGRFEKIPNSLGINIYIDYAHTPDALENVLKAIQKNITSAEQKIISVFGCGGERDKRKRPLMGKIASQYSNFIFLTNDNPREESPTAILEEIYQGISPRKKKLAKIILDRQKAIFSALSLAKKDDLVLIAGKGHENYQIIGKKKNTF